MNSWCESCARKNCCYTMEIRPKCYLPTTNTASGTPYLVGISSISRDSHEIAKTEPQTDLVNDSQVLVKDLVDDEFNPYDEECMRCKHLKLKCEFIPTYCKFESRDKPQTNADQHAQHIGSVGGVEPTWTKEEHEAFYTFLWNVINSNEMQDYIGMFESKDEPQTCEECDQVGRCERGRAVECPLTERSE